MKRLTVFSVLLALMCLSQAACAARPGEPAPAHPRLVMTPADVAAIAGRLGQVPLFDTSLAKAQAEVDAELALGIDTPEPKDYSGGYTHTRHKRNYAIAQKAGALFQILGEQKYARYVRDMLFQYASMYGDLPLHPKPRSYARGKIFWQCLNDANWLVYMSQAYDAIYESLSSAERTTLERDLFRPFADHLSVASPQFFNRVHNHSTWGTAAVGMIGLVMQDDALVQRALYGLDLDNFGNARDNDGGFIRQAGDKAGFMANLDSAFSPDGYYTEGPYYQRYAMYPYLVFAQSLRNAQYREQAFERNDAVLLKAVNTLLQLSDQDGEFFPLNDAQKGMSLQANELVTAVDIAFQASGDRRLLTVANAQNQVLLDGAGFAVANAIADNQAEPFEKASVAFADGQAGDEGGLAVLRSGTQAPLELVFKYSAQGLSHGHYDKLSLSLYEDGSEVLQDYGMARFVNLGQKGGGNYLPENSSWAKQSIAHNTLVADQRSHFNGSYDKGSQHHSELVYFDVDDDAVQIASAVETNAYPGIAMRRTVALLRVDGLQAPIMLDVVEASSKEAHQYDLPFHYFGQIVTTNFSLTTLHNPEPLGSDHGYQHLYLEAASDLDAAAQPLSSAKFSWLNRNRIYTLTTMIQPNDRLLLARLGANDPKFNLRRDPVLMLRRDNAGDAVFVSTLEPHGRYSPVSELASNASGQIDSIELAAQTPGYLAIRLNLVDNRQATLYLSKDPGTAQNHQLEVAGKQIRWQGPAHLVQPASAP